MGSRPQETVTAAHTDEYDRVRINNCFNGEQGKALLTPSNEERNKVISTSNEGLMRNLLRQKNEESTTYSIEAAINESVKANENEERRRDDTFVWQPPWKWCKRWKNVNGIYSILIHGEAMENFGWNSRGKIWENDKVSDTFIWRPPWISLY